MNLRPFYFNVVITGTALVYADTPTEARGVLDNAGVMVAGNKMLQFEIEITSPPRDTAIAKKGA